MTSRYRLALHLPVAIVVLALVAGSAWLAAAAVQPLALRYDMEMAGVRIATLTLRVDSEGDLYSSRMDARTRGLVDRLTRYRGSMTATSVNGTAGGLEPRHFEASYSTRRYDRDIVLTYDLAGEVVTVETHKRGEPQENDVAAELYVDTIDPLTAILLLREGLIAASVGGPREFTARVFDGRRRYDIAAIYRGEVETRVQGRRQNVHRLELHMTAIAGFNTNDLLAGWTGDMVEVLVSDDGRFVPLLLETRGGTLNSSMVLVDG